MEVSCSSELSAFDSVSVSGGEYPGSPSWGMWNQPEMARRGCSEVYTSSTSWNDCPGCTATINDHSHRGKEGDGYQTCSSDSIEEE